MIGNQLLYEETTRCLFYKLKRVSQILAVILLIKTYEGDALQWGRRLCSSDLKTNPSNKISTINKIDE